MFINHLYVVIFYLFMKTTIPKIIKMSHKRIDNCIAACSECAVESTHCISACLKESDVNMLARCIQLNQDCVAICLLALQAMASGSEFAKQICKLCEEICKACADECEKHSHMSHCKKCAKACRQCADECGKMNKVKKVKEVDKGNL